ncbi:MAG: DUF6054 family protein [Peptoniphilaceae bacterium]
MQDNIIKMTRQKELELESIIEILKEKIKGELISKVYENIKGVKIVLLNFEKYYFRTGGKAGLSILLTEDNNFQKVSLIGFAGGGGILNITFGANNDFLEKGEEILLGLGFEREIFN